MVHFYQMIQGHCFGFRDCMDIQPISDWWADGGEGKKFVYPAYKVGPY